MAKIYMHSERTRTTGTGQGASFELKDLNILKIKKDQAEQSLHDYSTSSKSADVWFKC